MNPIKQYSSVLFFVLIVFLLYTARIFIVNIKQGKVTLRGGTIYTKAEDPENFWLVAVIQSAAILILLCACIGAFVLSVFYPQLMYR